MMTKNTHSILSIPAVPNTPLVSIDDESYYGSLLLRKSLNLNFVENAVFVLNEKMYNENYQNSQAFSIRFQKHMQDVIEIIKNNVKYNAKIVEVGCGKGDFFSLLEKTCSFELTGYDAAYEGGNPNIFKRFLSKSDVLNADLIVLRHVLEHIPQPHLFIQLLKSIFNTAKIYIEVPNFDWIIKNQAFFDITYEHVNYFSKESLSKMFSGKLFDSGLLFDDQYQYVVSDVNHISDQFLNEYSNGLWESINFYELFPSLMDKISSIDSLLFNKRRGYLWGAATKGCMFLSHCSHLNKVLNKIDFAIDINPNKVGKFLPGSRVMIKTKEDFFQAATDQDLLIISNPIYLDEIISEIKKSHLKNIEVVSL